MKYITILCFERGEIHSFPYLDYWGDDFNNISEQLEGHYGIKFSENNCQWIIQDKLTLQVH